MTVIGQLLGGLATSSAALSSLALALVVVGRRRPGRLHVTFALGMVAFAAECGAGYGVLTAGDLPEIRRWWLGAASMAGVALPLPWLFFIEAMLHPAPAPRPRSWTAMLVGATVVTVATCAALAVWPAFDVADVAAPFHAARLEPAATIAVAWELLGTVAVVSGLELLLRTATRASLWRSKYLVLGLGAIFLGRFYFLSQVLLFQVLMAVYVTSGAAMVVLGNLAIAGSLVRERLRETEFTVSPHMMYRSVGVGVLGLYLLVIGVLSWLLTKLDIPETMFWTSLLVFVSAIGLAALLLSDNLRWRVKRFIALHLYRSKYDYREQWINFTHRLGSRLSLDDLVGNVLAAVTSAVGAAKAAIYVDDGNGTYRLHGHQWLERALPILDTSLPLLQRLARDGRPVALEAGGVLEFMPAGAVAVPLLWQGRLTGVMLVGPERTNTPYTVEDLQFLVTAGEQAAGAIVTARLSETLARAREFEAFHRLTSFVIHDLKNSIAGLSLLSENALKHFDDPEFQRDAITTLSRTVERMKGLLARLSGAPESTALQLRPVSVAVLAQEAIRLAGGRGSIVRDVVAVPDVDGDPDALLRVFQNLVKNAVEALATGEGVVTVRTYTEPGWVVFSVHDTGCGMSDEFVRTSLFAPFRSTKRGGWGIGLYQSKTIVDAHRGRIEGASKEGSGSTFVVRLPLAENRG